MQTVQRKIMTEILDRSIESYTDAYIIRQINPHGWETDYLARRQVNMAPYFVITVEPLLM